MNHCPDGQSTQALTPPPVFPERFSLEWLFLACGWAQGPFLCRVELSRTTKSHK